MPSLFWFRVQLSGGEIQMMEGSEKTSTVRETYEQNGFRSLRAGNPEVSVIMYLFLYFLQDLILHSSKAHLAENYK
jgi:hypothetical protein